MDFPGGFQGIFGFCGDIYWLQDWLLPKDAYIRMSRSPKKLMVEFSGPHRLWFAGPVKVWPTRQDGDVHIPRCRQVLDCREPGGCGGRTGAYKGRMTWLVAGAVIGSTACDYSAFEAETCTFARDGFESRLCYQGKTCQRSPLWAILLPKALESTSPCSMQELLQLGQLVYIISSSADNVKIVFSLPEI